MNYHDTFQSIVRECDDAQMREIHLRGLLSFVAGWLGAHSLSEGETTGVVFERAVRSYMETFLEAELERELDGPSIEECVHSGLPGEWETDMDEEVN